MPRLDFYHHSDLNIFVRIKLNAEVLLIGRSPECDVQLPDQKVSRVHAAICAVPEGHTIDDRSWNGTRVNDGVVTEPTLLKQGDRIYIENYIVIYQPDDAPVEKLAKAETLFDG